MSAGGSLGRGRRRPHHQPRARRLRAQHPEVLHELQDLRGCGERAWRQRRRARVTGRDPVVIGTGRPSPGWRLAPWKSVPAVQQQPSGDRLAAPRQCPTPVPRSAPRVQAARSAGGRSARDDADPARDDRLSDGLGMVVAGRGPLFGRDDCHRRLRRLRAPGRDRKAFHDGLHLFRDRGLRGRGGGSRTGHAANRAVRGMSRRARPLTGRLISIDDDRPAGHREGTDRRQTAARRRVKAVDLPECGR
jgi:hypothetical protein